MKDGKWNVQAVVAVLAAIVCLGFAVWRARGASGSDGLFFCLVGVAVLLLTASLIPQGGVLQGLDRYIAWLRAPGPKRILGIPNASWAIASVCLGIYGVSWWFKGEGPEDHMIEHLNFVYVLADVFALLTALLAFAQKMLRPVALIGLLLSLPTLFIVPLLLLLPPALH